RDDEGFSARILAEGLADASNGGRRVTDVQHTLAFAAARFAIGDKDHPNPYLSQWGGNLDFGAAGFAHSLASKPGSAEEVGVFLSALVQAAPKDWRHGQREFVTEAFFNIGGADLRKVASPMADALALVVAPSKRSEFTRRFSAEFDQIA